MTLSELRTKLGLASDDPIRIGVGGEIEIVGSLASPKTARIRLLRVVNPFGRSALDLNRLMAEDPTRGAETLETLVEEVRAEIEDAIRTGADGIAYYLYGADSDHCSPMQYGGFYLERDRELLAIASDMQMNMLVVVGGEGAYIEIVADLPAAIMAWDVAATRRAVDEVRLYRDGLLCAEDDSADLIWQAEPLVSDSLKRGEAIA